MRPLAIIPAKAKSNRIPNKNVRLFKGRPLYEWTLYTVLLADVFDRVVLSTDIEFILSSRPLRDIPQLHIVPRPAQLATDGARVLDVCRDLLEQYSNYEIFCILYPTAPLREVEDIRGSYSLLLDGGYDGVIGGTRMVQNWWQMFQLKLDGRLGQYWERTFPKICEIREESLPKRLVDNGALYWMETEAFLEQNTFFPEKLGIYEMPYERSIDIDTETDFRLAEYYAE